MEEVTWQVRDALMLLGTVHLLPLLLSFILNEISLVKKILNENSFAFCERIFISKISSNVKRNYIHDEQQVTKVSRFEE